MFTISASRWARSLTATLIALALLTAHTSDALAHARGEYLTSYEEYLGHELLARNAKLRNQNVAAREYRHQFSVVEASDTEFQTPFVALRNLALVLGGDLFPRFATHQKYVQMVEEAIDVAIAASVRERERAGVLETTRLLLTDREIMYQNALRALRSESFPDFYDFIRFVASRNHVHPPQAYRTWFSYVADVREQYYGLLVVRAENRRRIADIEAQLAIQRCERCPWYPPRRRPPQFEFHFARGP